MESIAEKETVKKLPEPNKAQKECIYNTKNGHIKVLKNFALKKRLVKSLLNKWWRF